MQDDAFWAEAFKIQGGKKRRHLLDRSVDVLNVEDFIDSSIDGNDIRNAIQRACNAAQAGHKTVVIGPGNYRLVVGKPIVVGTCNIRGEGGKIWCSLPDGYTNPNNTVTESYTAHNQLNEFGNLVDWVNDPAVSLPWNGKTQVFTGAVYSILENLWIDWGWGTVGAPSGVHPITGNRNDDESFTYYQGWNNCQNTTWRNCQFFNAPGAHIEVGHDLVLDGCLIQEWGDHGFYCGQDPGGTGSQKNYKIHLCQFIATRAAVGTVSQSAYVFSTFRDAVKLRGNSNSVILDNDFYNSSQVITAIQLEVNDGQPGDVSRVTIANNNAHVGVFVDCLGFRNDGGFGVNDYRLRNVSIKNNNVEMTNQGIRFRSACDGFSVTNNEFYGSGTVATFAGHPAWVEPLKGVRFVGNSCASTGQIAMYISGKMRDMVIRGNDFRNTGAPCDSSNTVIYVANPFDIDGVNIFNLETRFTQLLIENNTCDNYYAWIADGGYPAYSGASNYAFATKNGVAIYSIVSFGGLLYRNLRSTIASAPGGSNWTVFTLGTGSLIFRNNIRSCSSASASPNNSIYLAYFSGSVGLLRQIYIPTHNDNINTNTLAETVGFSFGIITDQEMVASSRYNTISSTTLQSGGNVGSINYYNEILAVNDFNFRGTGSCDQFGIWTGDARGVPVYVDIGRDAASQPFLRVFSGLGIGSQAALTLHSSGRIYYGEISNTLCVSDSWGAGSPEGVVTAAPGSTYRRTDPANASEAFYHKVTLSGSTGWVASTAGGGLAGSGSPESVIALSPGSFYWDTTNKILFVKDTGTGTTGWREIVA